MADLKNIVREAVLAYAGGGPRIQVFPLFNEERGVYAVTVVDTPPRTQAAGIVVMARVEGNHVVIEEDITDHPLVDTLMQAGIPRHQIFLAYENEAAPESVSDAEIR